MWLGYSNQFKLIQNGKPNNITEHVKGTNLFHHKFKAFAIEALKFSQTYLSWLGGSFMKNYDYWKSFISSGKIDDYLHYIACTQEEGMDELIQVVDNTVANMDLSMRNLCRDKEGGFIAGINYRDGNGSISHAGW
jgi:hypothetical protein